MVVPVPMAPGGDSNGATVVRDRVRRLVCAARNVSCQICARRAVAWVGIDKGFCGSWKNWSAGIDPHGGDFLSLARQSHAPSGRMEDSNGTADRRGGGWSL